MLTSHVFPSFFFPFPPLTFVYYLVLPIVHNLTSRKYKLKCVTHQLLFSSSSLLFLHVQCPCEECLVWQCLLWPLGADSAANLQYSVSHLPLTACHSFPLTIKAILWKPQTSLLGFNSTNVCTLTT